VQFTQEEAAVSALQPEFMVVNDDDELRHFINFHRGRWNTKSITAGRHGCTALWAELAGREGIWPQRRDTERLGALFHVKRHAALIQISFERIEVCALTNLLGAT
jgi:hypothetical protein